jgi:hypothetical protein
MTTVDGCRPRGTKEDSPTRKTALDVVTTWGLLLGLVLGFATDAVVNAAGV